MNLIIPNMFDQVSGGGGVWTCSGVAMEWCRKFKLISFRNKNLFNRTNSVPFTLVSSSSTPWLASCCFHFFKQAPSRLHHLRAEEEEVGRNMRRCGGGGQCCGFRYQSLLTFLLRGDLRRTSSSSFYRGQRRWNHSELSQTHTGEHTLKDYSATIFSY